MVLLVLFSALCSSTESDNLQSVPCSPVSLSLSDSDESKSDSSASASPLPSAQPYNKRKKTPILLPLLESSPFSNNSSFCQNLQTFPILYLTTNLLQVLLILAFTSKHKRKLTMSNIA